MYSTSTRFTFGIARRLYLGFAVIVAILLILVSVSYSNFSRLSQANEWNTHTFTVLAGSADMTESLVNMETGERGFALTGAEASLEPYIAGKEAFQKSLKSVIALTADNAQQQLRLNTLKEMESQWRSVAAEPAIALRRTANDNAAAMEAVIRFEQTAKGKALMDKMRGTLDEMDQAEQVLLVARSTTAKELHSATNATLIGGGALAAVLSIVLAVVLTRMVLTPLRAILNATEDLRSGDGDLTYRLPELPAEFGQVAISLNGFIERLHSIITDVRKGTQSIATASEEIAAGNLDLSSRTEQQASSLEETASSMEELTSTVQQNADNARQATGLATSATTVALRGSGVVAEVVSTMSAISDSARQIADIIGVIDGIAFQTNILALNAAVEAARAGEQGRGFAVVASEVRNLAHRSATAAKEIKTLITDSVNRVETGSRLVGDAGETMEEIVVSVRRVTDIMTEISAASSEQEAGIMQINQAINEMDNVTQQNAALVEEAAAASQSLQEQALRLEAVVGVFKLDIAHGGANATASRQALARPNAATMRLAAP